MKKKFKKSRYYLPEEDRRIICQLCGFGCNISPGNKGICETKINIDGEMYCLVWGRPEGLAVDPIEKKPLYNFKPGSRVLSFGTRGCNFICTNCQNYTLAQSEISEEYISKSNMIEPEIIREIALNNKPAGIAYTYNEPTIFFEFAEDIIRLCRKNEDSKDLFHVFVTNGFFSNKVLDVLSKEHLIDAVNIDLKFISSDKYRQITGGKLSVVLNTIEYLARNTDIHIEITNLVIPWENDSDDDFLKLSEFICSISEDIPIHFSRFYPYYKMMDKSRTDLSRLQAAKDTALKTGLKYVYIGNANVPGAQNTYCPICGTEAVARDAYDIRKKFIVRGNSAHCSNCDAKLNIVI